MPDSPRIEQLRRRVRADPASIAFAALAEEYRKDSRFPEAIETCRQGLQRHPAYLSARVTLGRALLGVGDYEAARLELEAVLRVAPENLAAIRAMAEIYSRLQEAEEDVPSDDVGLGLTEEPRIDEVTAEPSAEDAPKASAAAPRVPLAVASLAPESRRSDRTIARLERFLNAIAHARAQLGRGARPGTSAE